MRLAVTWFCHFLKWGAPWHSFCLHTSRHRKLRTPVFALCELTHRKAPGDESGCILSASYPRPAFGDMTCHGWSAESYRERTKSPSNPTARIYGWGHEGKQRRPLSLSPSMVWVGLGDGRFRCQPDQTRHPATVGHLSRHCHEGVQQTRPAVPGAS